jgi:CBS domain containing-hemolysin-like protein
MSDLFTYELQGSSTKESSVAPPETGKSLEKGTDAPEEVPVDEIITSAYLVLLVHAIVFGEITGDQVSKPYMLPKMNALACFVCSRLPKNNFWLFIRVLKAFLALQGGVS